MLLTLVNDKFNPEVSHFNDLFSIISSHTRTLAELPFTSFYLTLVRATSHVAAGTVTGVYVRSVVRSSVLRQLLPLFKSNFLGALDGTHIQVNVLEADKPRYRNRKGDITTNVLGVVAPDMQFIYVLAGWEGSAVGSRVLRDALSLNNGFSVPQGCYYLCDARYMNCEGFLAPYRGQRYHLSLFNPQNQPNTPQEFFNMKHSQARNVMERTFGILKGRWAILRG